MGTSAPALPNIFSEIERLEDSFEHTRYLGSSCGPALRVERGPVPVVVIAPFALELDNGSSPFRERHQPYAGAIALHLAKYASCSAILPNRMLPVDNKGLVGFKTASKPVLLALRPALVIELGVRGSSGSFVVARYRDRATLGYPLLLSLVEENLRLCGLQVHESNGWGHELKHFVSPWIRSHCSIPCVHLDVPYDFPTARWGNNGKQPYREFLTTFAKSLTHIANYCSQIGPVPFLVPRLSKQDIRDRIRENVEENKRRAELWQKMGHWDAPPLHGPSFEDENLEGLDLRAFGKALKAADFTDANLQGADLRGCNLKEACFENANVTNANLAGCNLSQAHLYHANLTGAILTGAKLKWVRDARKANFTDAVVEGANFQEVDLKKSQRTYLLERGAMGIKPVSLDEEKEPKNRLVLGGKTADKPTGKTVESDTTLDRLMAEFEREHGKGVDGNGESE
jgi:uncharacterized protein YjbI with pentapeptide repeats